MIEPSYISYFDYSIVLALHVVGFIVWCAGLFYWIRIMVYQSEVVEKQQAYTEVVLLQLQIMSERLYRIIIVPGMILTWAMGLILMVTIEAWQFGWFHLKFTLLICLTVYQFNGVRLMRCYRMSIANTTTAVPRSNRMRMYNEVATLLIVGIVFSVILQDFFLIALMYAGFVTFLVLAFLGYRFFQGREMHKNP